MAYKQMGAKTRTGLKHRVLQNVPRLRIALFTHDTFGLGHVRRSLRIIDELSRHLPHAAVLFITGSPALHRLSVIPSNTDIVKIPTVVKTGSPGSQPPHLPLSVSVTTQIRARIIKEAVLAFEPDVFIVDNFPLGSQSELLPILQTLKLRPTRTILGLRDILDEPEVVRADWERQGVYDVLERYYDKILIYGNKHMFDAVDHYALSPIIAKKVYYCGYVTETSPSTANRRKVREEFGVDGPFILVTGGGGGDAFPLLDTFVRALPHLPDMYSVIVTGPLMGEDDRTELQRRINGNPKVVVRDFVPGLSNYFGAAKLVITMCGYNTAAEIITQKARTIVVPRTWKYGEHKKRVGTVREAEQLIRAQAFARMGFIKLIHPDELNAERLSGMARKLLNNSGRRPRMSLNLRGLNSAAREIMKTVLSEKEVNSVLG